MTAKYYFLDFVPRGEDTFTICRPFYKTKFILLDEVLYSSSSQLRFDLKTAILAELPFLHRFFKFIVSVKRRVEMCIFYWLKQENFKSTSSKKCLTCFCWGSHNPFTRGWYSQGEKASYLPERLLCFVESNWFLLVPCDHSVFEAFMQN